jgi:hypothetical protein
MKLAIRLGLMVVGLLLIGGAGFAGWRYFRPQEAPAPVAAKGKGEAKPPAAGSSKTPTAAVTPSTPGTPATPQTAPPAPVAQAAEKPPVAAQEKAPAAPPQATPPAPAPAAQALGKPVPGPQEKAAAAPASRDAEQERLIRVYGSMKPKEAALVMGQLDPGLSVTILAGLQERQAAKILGHLPPKTAADLVTRLSQIKRAPEADASAKQPPAGGKS